MKLPHGCMPDAMWPVSGANASPKSDWRVCKGELARNALGSFPSELTVGIKSLACEFPAALGLPLSRLNVADVAPHAQRSGLVARISDSTVWRWPHEDAIRPWKHRCWIFSRDPPFQAKGLSDPQAASAMNVARLKLFDLFNRRSKATA